MYMYKFVWCSGYFLYARGCSRYTESGDRKGKNEKRRWNRERKRESMGISTKHVTMKRNVGGEEMVGESSLD